MDELPEFNKSTLEVLRGPLEDRKITISRVATTVTYPSNFMLIASMNPCECGYYGSDLKKCTCNSISIKRYVNKISGPMLDRIDLHIEVKPVEYEKMASDNTNETSKQIKERVDKARQIQLERYEDLGIFCNAELDSTLLHKFCKLDEKSKEIMGKAFSKFRIKRKSSRQNFKNCKNNSRFR